MAFGLPGTDALDEAAAEARRLLEFLAPGDAHRVEVRDGPSIRSAWHNDVLHMLNCGRPGS